MPDIPYHAFTHRSKALGGTDPIEIPTSLPTAICSGSDFTAEDGSYWSLAQLTPCNPSAFGAMDQIEIVNDPADGTGRFFVGTTSSVQGVLKVVNGYCEVAYSAVVIFDAPVDTTTITATLYMGTGVGGGASRPLGAETETLELVAGAQSNPRLRISGHLALNAPVSPGTGQRPTISPILLVEGADVDVQESYFYVTVLTSLADSGGSSFFTP